MYSKLNNTYGGGNIFNLCGKGPTKMYHMSNQIVPIDHNFGYNALTRGGGNGDFSNIESAYPKQCSQVVSRPAAGFVSDRYENPNVPYGTSAQSRALMPSLGPHPHSF